MSKTDGSDTYAFTYTETLKVETVSLNGVELHHFGYNANGARVSEQRSDGTLVFFVGEYYEYSLQGTEVHEKKYYSREAMREDGTLYFILTDHLGSTSVVTDENGNYLWEIRYDAWGAMRYTSGTSPTEKLYTGQRLSSDLGLYDYKARWYDPLVGRFLMEDAIIPQQGVMRLDQFAYVNNVPIIYSDPEGFMLDDGCRTEGCTGDPNVIVHGLLIGGLPAIQPYTGYRTYSEDAEQGWYYPSQLTNPITSETIQADTRIVNGFLLASDIAAGIQNHKFFNDDKVIRVWVMYQEMDNDSISITSIKVTNDTKLDIGVVAVSFSSKQAYNPCQGSVCYALPEYHYMSNPSRITHPGGGLGTISGESAQTISLLPSGYHFNPYNSFPAYQAVTITVRLAYTSFGGKNGTEWPLLRYVIPER